MASIQSFKEVSLSAFLPFAQLPPVNSRSHQLAQPQPVFALGLGPHTCLCPAAPRVAPQWFLDWLGRQAGSGTEGHPPPPRPPVGRGKASRGHRCWVAPENEGPLTLCLKEPSLSPQLHPSHRQRHKRCSHHLGATWKVPDHTSLHLAIPGPVPRPPGHLLLSLQSLCCPLHPASPSVSQ